VKSEVNKVLFIVNKYAGTGYQPEVEGKIIDACENQSIECTIEFTKDRGHATELAMQAVAENKFQQVIAVGGDGTVNEVAKGLLNSSITMGIIPKGSGNGLARHLQIPINISQALKTLFDSHIISMDTFQVNGKLSLNVSGIGFDGHIANLFGAGKKRGFQGYAKHAMGQFLQFKEFEAQIQTENKVIDRKAFVIAIANSSQYGNNARIAPAASVCDELLHINILKKVPPYRLDFIYDFFMGKVDRSPYCEIIESKKFTITVSDPMSYHIDGEPCGKSDRFIIELLPGSLKMLAPKHSINP
jgi:YegS/Rv2252/BmrU family lipid kinase